MREDLRIADSKRFPIVLMNLYTRESFLYKDMNYLLRQIDLPNSS